MCEEQLHYNYYMCFYVITHVFVLHVSDGHAAAIPLRHLIDLHRVSSYGSRCSSGLDEVLCGHWPAILLLQT